MDIRRELTVFAQAWRNTLAKFPEIVASEQVRIASSLLWLEIDQNGNCAKSTDLRMTRSQASSIRSGKKDAQGRSLEGLAIALFLHSQAALDFYLQQLSTLISQRGEDFQRGAIAPERQQILVEIVAQRSNIQAPVLTIKKLLEHEFIRRGLNPNRREDRERLVLAYQVLGATLSVANIDAAMAGSVEDELLCRLQQILVRVPATGTLWTIEDLLQVKVSQKLVTCQSSLESLEFSYQSSSSLPSASALSG